MTHTVVLVIQYGDTALDDAREGKTENAKDGDSESRYDEVIKYLEKFGKLFVLSRVFCGVYIVACCVNEHKML